MRFGSLALVFAFAIATATAQPVIDGTLTDPQYTLLDDNAGGPGRGFGNQNNLNALYAYSTAGTLYLGVAGSVAIGNRIVVFLDTRDGGFASGDYGTGGPGAVANFDEGSTFDAGFEADFALAIGTDGTRSNYFVDLVELRGTRSDATTSTNRFLGDANGSAAIAAVTNDDAGQVTQGFEIAIPFGAFTKPGGDALAVTQPIIQAFAALSADNGTLSNLFLSPAGSGQGNFGDGAVTFGNEPPNPLSYALENVIASTAGEGYRLLSVPMATAVTDLARFSLVSGAGGFTTGANCSVGGITNLFSGYTGDAAASNGGYTSPQTTTATLQPGEGFFWYLFGEGNANTAFPTACSNGTLTSTVDALPLVFAAGNTAPGADAAVSFPTRPADPAVNDGFYMLGNPFSTAFDVDGLSISVGTVQAGVQVWDPALGDYDVLTGDGSDLTAAGADDASAWQGFFVETEGAESGPTFTFDAAAAQQGSADGDGLTARSSSGPALISFRAVGEGLGGAAAVVRFDEEATEGWDRFDLSKLAPFSSAFVQLGPVGQDRSGVSVVKASESRSSVFDGTVEIPLSFATSATEGIFELSWPQFSIPAEWTATLRDVVTGQSTDLQSVGSVTFEHSGGAPTERFVLSVTPLIVAGEASPEVSVVEAPRPNPSTGTATMRLIVERPQTVRVEAFDLLGRRVATVFDATVEGERTLTIEAGSLAPGVYVLRVLGETFSASRRFVVAR